MVARPEQQLAFLRNIPREHRLVLSDLLGDRTPLMLAAQCGSLPVMDFLLREACVDPDVPSPKDGFTALHCVFFAAAAAEELLCEEAVSLLLEHGASRERRDHLGRCPGDLLLLPEGGGQKAVREDEAEAAAGKPPSASAARGARTTARAKSTSQRRCGKLIHIERRVSY